MSDEFVHLLAVGDTRRPLGFLLQSRNGNPIDLASLTVQCFGVTETGAEWIASAATPDATRVTKHPTRTFTGAADDWLTDNDHLAENGDQLILTTAGVLPSPLALATRYFVRDAEPNRFKVSLSPGGSPVDLVGAGTGAHSYYIVGSGHVTFTDADVDTAGTFWLWIRPKDGGNDFDTYPIVRRANNRSLRVEIVSPS